MTFFLWILGVLLLLLCLPVSLLVDWDGEIRLWVSYLFLKVRINQPKRDAGKLEENEEQEEKKELKKKEKKTGSEPQALTDTIEMTLDLIRSATGGVRMLWRNLRVRGLELHMIVAKGDAAGTALEYGRMNAYLHGAYATLRSLVNIDRAVLDLRPDFLSDRGSFTLRFRVRVTPLVVLAAAVRVAASFLWKMAVRGAQSGGGIQQERK